MNLSRLVPSDFSGCILVTRDGDTLFESSYGFADLSNRLPNRIDTRFATASAGKGFVAAGILKLVESDRLPLNATLGDILRFDLKAIDPQVTVEQLLTHTSGVPDYFDESTMEDYDELWREFPNYRIRTSSDLIPLFIDKPMMYPRGERFQYNNTGYVLLGLIIEQIAGMPFDEYLGREVFEPCGMSDTGYFELDRLPERCANSYIPDGRRGGYHTNIYSVDAKGTGAGGAFTTVRDVQRFWTALRENRLLKKPTAESMVTIHADLGDEQYG